MIFKHISGDGRWRDFGAWRHRSNQVYLQLFGHVFMWRVDYDSSLYQIVKRLPLGGDDA